MTWVGPLVGTQWSATPIDAPLASSQVPSDNDPTLRAHGPRTPQAKRFDLLLSEVMG